MEVIIQSRAIGCLALALVVNQTNFVLFCSKCFMPTNGYFTTISGCTEVGFGCAVRGAYSTWMEE